VSLAVIFNQPSEELKSQHHSVGPVRRTGGREAGPHTNSHRSGWIAQMRCGHSVMYCTVRCGRAGLLKQHGGSRSDDDTNATYVQSRNDLRLRQGTTLHQLVNGTSSSAGENGLARNRCTSQDRLVPARVRRDE